MLAPKHIPLVIKQVLRQRTRTLLTVAGVGVAMFLFVLLSALLVMRIRADKLQGALAVSQGFLRDLAKQLPHRRANLGYNLHRKLLLPESEVLF